MAQEFGTLSVQEVITALAIENMKYHEAKRNGVPYDPNCEGGIGMRRAFYPDEDSWRRKVITYGREIFLNCFKMFIEDLEPASTS